MERGQGKERAGRHQKGIPVQSKRLARASTHFCKTGSCNAPCHCRHRRPHQHARIELGSGRKTLFRVGVVGPLKGIQNPWNDCLLSHPPAFNPPTKVPSKQRTTRIFTLHMNMNRKTRTHRAPLECQVLCLILQSTDTIFTYSVEISLSVLGQPQPVFLFRLVRAHLEDCEEVGGKGE